ncbi:hypothetical protein ACJX0J_030252, partial [Zea mays]
THIWSLYKDGHGEGVRDVVNLWTQGDEGINNYTQKVVSSPVGETGLEMQDITKWELPQHLCSSPLFYVFPFPIHCNYHILFHYFLFSCISHVTILSFLKPMMDDYDGLRI